MQSWRNSTGGIIDRSRRLSFTFDGRRLAGHPGDTLASALLANGIHLVGRSFKYHRPRGIVGSGAEEPNALVRLGEGGAVEPNARATTTELFDGLVASSQNRWPSLAFDAGALNSVASGLIPAGFYYKTFMWPPKAWTFYERFIRRAAGLGKAPEEPDPDVYEKRFAHCDVLVVGAGPTGLQAARAAGRSGARVILADEQAVPGGSLLAEHVSLDGVAGQEWPESVRAELAGMTDVTVLPRTTVAGYYDHNFLVAVERVTDHLPGGESPLPRQRLWKIRARHVVLATGAIERPLVFPGNDRPGVMLANAVRAFANRWGVRCGARAVVFTNNDSAYRSAIDAADCGIHVTTIVDCRAAPRGRLVEEAHSRGIDVMAGSVIAGVEGRKRVRGVAISSLDDSAPASGRKECDLVMMSGGWNPTVHLASQSGTRLAWDESLATFVPGDAPSHQTSAGAAAGTFGLVECLRSGTLAGAEAAARAGFDSDAPAVPEVDGDTGDGALGLEAFWHRPASPRDGKAFHDLQNDVTTADVALATRENYVSVEHFKRYTTTGMGTDQGKTSNVNGLAILAGHVGSTIPGVGHTTYRPFYTPVTIGALAGIDTGGDLYDPVRKTPMHTWHEKNGAHFEDVGQWKRPYCYPRAGETVDEAVQRETLAARTSIGILDASTLGKIDIQGADAAEFLDRIYTNMFSTLKVGRCRYGLMCRDDGMVFDDGVTARIAENRFLMSTTTGGASTVLNWLEEWLQTEWTDLEVYCTSVTTHWAAIAVAGPKSRALVSELTPADLSAEAFPFMAWRDADIAGIAGRIFRISFSGETGFELQVPASYGLALWRNLMTAGEKYGITAYGTEAMHVLRAEKGFIIAGQDTDGTTTPHDLGMSWIVSKKKKDFLGMRGLSRPDTLREDRKQLVGLLADDPAVVIPEGAHVSPQPAAQPPVPMEGWVSSSYMSPNCGRSIALALVSRGHDRIGEEVAIPLEKGIVRARIVKPVFFDEEGARLRG